MLLERTLIAFVIAMATVVVPGRSAEAQAEGTLPNFLIILTDDQHDSNLRSMPIIRRGLVARGIRFRNAFVADPLCCPSRAAILTGSYAHTNGVYWNSRRYGGTRAFNENGNEMVRSARSSRVAAIGRD